MKWFGAGWTNNTWIEGISKQDFRLAISHYDSRYVSQKQICQNMNYVWRAYSLVPVGSSLLSNFLYPFFIIHQSHETLRFLSDIASLIPPTWINILKVWQSLSNKGYFHLYNSRPNIFRWLEGRRTYYQKLYQNEMELRNWKLLIFGIYAPESHLWHAQNHGLPSIPELSKPEAQQKEFVSWIFKCGAGKKSRALWNSK